MKKKHLLTLVLLASSLSLYANSLYTHGEPADPTADDELFIVDNWRNKKNQKKKIVNPPVSSNRQKDGSVELEQQEIFKKEQLENKIKTAEAEQAMLKKHYNEFTQQANEYDKSSRRWLWTSYTLLPISLVLIMYDVSKPNMNTIYGIGKDLGLIAATIISFHKTNSSLNKVEYYQNKAYDTKNKLNEAKKYTEKLKNRYC